jgi:aminoglycoside 3-N-acetyltransferase I
MLVRRLGPGDGAVGAEVALRFKQRQVPATQVEAFLADPRHFLFVAEGGDGEGPVGFVLAYEIPRIDAATSMLYIHEIEVDPAYRRRGIGSELVGLARKAVRDNGWQEAFVFTSEAYPEAVEFYRATGARVEEERGLVFVYDSPVR